MLRSRRGRRCAGPLPRLDLSRRFRLGAIRRSHRGALGRLARPLPSPVVPGGGGGVFLGGLRRRGPPLAGAFRLLVSRSSSVVVGGGLVRGALHNVHRFAGKGWLGADRFTTLGGEDYLILTTLLKICIDLYILASGVHCVLVAQVSGCACARKGVVGGRWAHVSPNYFQFFLLFHIAATVIGCRQSWSLSGSRLDKNICCRSGSIVVIAIRRSTIVQIGLLSVVAVDGLVKVLLASSVLWEGLAGGLSLSPKLLKLFLGQVVLVDGLSDLLAFLLHDALLSLRKPPPRNNIKQIYYKVRRYGQILI